MYIETKRPKFVFSLFSSVMLLMLFGCSKASTSQVPTDSTFSLCTDDALNSGQCSTSANRYVTGTLGGNVTSWNNSSSGTAVNGTIPLGFYSGNTISFTDANLLASNIKSGVSIFNVTGSYSGPSPCTDDALNSGQCSTAANRYVTGTLGGNVTSWNNSSSGTAVNGTIPLGFYSGNTISFTDANLLALNIKSGVSIFNVTGSYSGSGVILMSNMHRDIATTQITAQDEAVTNAGVQYTNNDPGYRAVPRINKDDDGYIGGTFVDRSTWAATTCGTSQSTVALRIADCASVFGANATWDGSVKANAGQGVWKLVTRTGSGSREVWRDERTGLLWSSLVTSTGLNWCKATGSNNIPGNPTAEVDPNNYCDNSMYQNTSGQAISACFEDGGVNFTDVDAEVDNAGKAGLGRSSSPAVSWRLPTKYDHLQAEVNGVRFVMPDMGPNNLGIWEWSASVASSNRSYAWYFFASDGSVIFADRGTLNGRARCLGR